MLGFHLSSLSRPLRIAIAFGACATVGMTSAMTFAVASSGGHADGIRTVRIDAFRSGYRHQPRVDCHFKVKFYNFREDERANLIFRLQPPTGRGQVLLRLRN